MTIALPRKTLPLLLLGLGLVLIAASAYFILRDVSSRSDFATVPVKVSLPAPELTLMNTQGVSQSLVDYRGQVVLVNLWATWCPPCKEEMPALQSFYDKYRDQGFVVLAINDGDPAEDDEAACPRAAGSGPAGATRWTTSWGAGPAKLSTTAAAL